MGRRYRKRFYKRRSSKWASCIKEIPIMSEETAPGVFANSVTLITNPIQDSVSVPQTYTIKNVESSFLFEASISDSEVVEELACYIMYVPQGMNLTPNYNLEHPEYIMAYKFYGSPSIDNNEITAGNGIQYQPVKIKSRLSRKLQTGDQIILFYKGKNTYSRNRTFSIQGLLRWWTKAN